MKKQVTNKKPSLWLKQAVFSPEPYYAPHWQKNRGDKSCEGRSHFFMSYQEEMLPETETILRRDMPDLANDFCGWLRDNFLLKLPEEEGRFINGVVLNIDSCSTYSKSYSDGGVIWIMSRQGRRRSLLNLGEIATELAAAIPSRAIVIADPGHFPYLVQYALPTRSKIVTGMHSGGMWGAVRWMTAGQIMAEILPILGHGDSCMNAKMVGVHYFAAVCKGCIRDKGGSIETEKVTEMIASAITGIGKNKELTTCKGIPALTKG